MDEKADSVLDQGVCFSIRVDSLSSDDVNPLKSNTGATDSSNLDISLSGTSNSKEVTQGTQNIRSESCTEPGSNQDSKDSTSKTTSRNPVGSITSSELLNSVLQDGNRDFPGRNYTTGSIPQSDLPNGVSQDKIPETRTRSLPTDFIPPNQSKFSEQIDKSFAGKWSWNLPVDPEALKEARLPHANSTRPSKNEFYRGESSDSKGDFVVERETEDVANEVNSDSLDPPIESVGFDAEDEKSELHRKQNSDSKGDFEVERETEDVVGDEVNSDSVDPPIESVGFDGEDEKNELHRRQSSDSKGGFEVERVTEDVVGDEVNYESVYPSIESVGFDGEDEKALLPSTSSKTVTASLVSAGGTPTDTVYTYGVDSESLTVSVAGRTRLEVRRGRGSTTRYTPRFTDVGEERSRSTSVVQAANGALYRVERVCDGDEREVIDVFKDGELICEVASRRV